MITARLMRDTGILVIAPGDKLETTDFERLRLLVDPYLEKRGELTGLLIDAETFFGWEDFSSMLSRIRLVRNYEQKIERVAAVTDKAYLAIVPHLADYVVAAKLRHFDYQDRDEALNWLQTDLDLP
jgi:hypothetical protein